MWAICNAIIWINRNVMIQYWANVVTFGLLYHQQPLFLIRALNAFSLCLYRKYLPAFRPTIQQWKQMLPNHYRSTFFDKICNYLLFYKNQPAACNQKCNCNVTWTLYWNKEGSIQEPHIKTNVRNRKGGIKGCSSSCC